MSTSGFLRLKLDFHAPAPVGLSYRLPSCIWSLFILNADSDAAELVTPREWNTCKTWREERKQRKSCGSRSTHTSFFSYFFYSTAHQALDLFVQYVVCLCVSVCVSLCWRWAPAIFLKQPLKRRRPRYVWVRRLDNTSVVKKKKEKINVCQTKWNVRLQPIHDRCGLECYFPGPGEDGEARRGLSTVVRREGDFEGQPQPLTLPATFSID